MPTSTLQRLLMSTASLLSDDAPLDAPDSLSVTCQSTRLRPYSRLHDDLRRRLLRLMLQALDLDASDPGRRTTFASLAEHTLRCCEAHLAHEEALLHQPLRARAPRALMAVELDHEQLEQGLAELRRTLAKLRDAPSVAAADAIARELRLRLSLFVSDALAHMVEEESTLTRAWWAHFSDDETRACLEAAAQQAPHLRD